MASIYKKGNKIYMSWYDPITGNAKNKSLKMTYNKDNLKKAEDFGKAFQEELDKEIEKLKQVGVKFITLQSAFNHFLRNNVKKDKNTISGYKIFFNLFTSKFPADSAVAELNKIKVESWMTDLHSLDRAQNTLFGYQKILKKFLKFLFEYNYLIPFQINSDLLFKQELKPIITFDEEDIKTILKSLATKNSNFRTFIYAFFYSGLRPTDLLQLKVEDINVVKGTMQYYEQKIKDYNIVPIHPTLLPILQKRMDEVKSGRLFSYAEDKNIGKAFQRFLEDLGLDTKGYNLRTFRKTFISIAHDKDIDIATVSKLVGHKKIDTTMKYYTKISLSKKGEELKKFELPEPDKDENESRV